jgi:hypothetical protein
VLGVFISTASHSTVAGTTPRLNGYALRRSLSQAILDEFAEVTSNGEPGET